MQYHQIEIKFKKTIVNLILYLKITSSCEMNTKDYKSMPNFFCETLNIEKY